MHCISLLLRTALSLNIKCSHFFHCRYDLDDLLGGSHAQKDVLSQILLHAAAKAGRTRLLEQLVSERLSRCQSEEGKKDFEEANRRFLRKVMAEH